jgi:hypothetical protein
MILEVVGILSGSIAVMYLGSLRFAKWALDRYDPKEEEEPEPHKISFHDRRMILQRQENEWIQRGVALERLFPENFKDRLAYQRTEAQLTEIRNALAQLDREERDQRYEEVEEEKKS